MVNTHTGVILLGRGGYSSAPVEQMERLTQAVASGIHVDLVQGVFIDQETPSLLDVLTTYLEMALERVFVIPVYLPTDRNLDCWLAGVMQRWLYDHPRVPFELILTESIGDSTALDTARIQILEPYLTIHKASLTPTHSDPNSPEWSAIPPHQYHVLFCQGPRCNTIGAGKIAARLSQYLKEKNLIYEDVLIVKTGCLFPCNLGPMMVVYPDGVWYGDLTEDAVEQIVDQHFIGGKVVERYIRCPDSASL